MHLEIGSNLTKFSCFVQLFVQTKARRPRTLDAPQLDSGREETLPRRLKEFARGFDYLPLLCVSCGAVENRENSSDPQGLAPAQAKSLKSKKSRDFCEHCI